MKRYMAFAYGRYYPEGGMSDFLGLYDSYEAAHDAVTSWLMDDSKAEFGEGGGDVFDTKEGITRSFRRGFRSEAVVEITT